MQMIAPTFGIALMTGPGEPLPALPRTGTVALWEKDLPADGTKRDTWEQIQWVINNHSVGSRVREIEKRIKHIGDGEKLILARAGKVREVEQIPSSVITTLPRREKGVWDKNLKKRNDKNRNSNQGSEDERAVIAR